MRHMHLGSFFTVLTVTMCLSFINAHADESVVVADNKDFQESIEVFDAWLEQRVYREDLPSVSIGIVFDQELVWAKAYGYSDLDSKTKATPDTAYRIASNTKLFTATAIMLLRDSGKLQLDDPVAKHLEWFSFDDQHAATPAITIRHLLTHSSGLIRELPGLYWDDAILPDKDLFISLLQESSSILGREEKYKYSNVAFSVLGYIVEAASGESYADFLKKNILDPLRMDGTEVLPRREMPTLATGYEFRVPGAKRPIEPFTESNAFTAAANMASTVPDLANFLSSQFGSSAGAVRILDTVTLKEMHRVHWLAEDWSYGRGLGWGVRLEGERTVIRHGGYVPGYTTSVSAAPADKIGVIVLANAGDAAPSSIAAQAWKLVAPSIIAATTEAVAATDFDSSWSGFLGKYRFLDGQFVRVMFVKNELAIFELDGDDPWETRIRLEHLSGAQFKMLNQTQEGELVTFETDDANVVTQMTMPGYSFQKID
jgi:CubicO group peptidase (beta-lactamase class C family)